MVSYKVRLLLLPTGSRGLQYASYKIYSTWVMCVESLGSRFGWPGALGGWMFHAVSWTRRSCCACYPACCSRVTSATRAPRSTQVHLDDIKHPSTKSSRSPKQSAQALNTHHPCTVHDPPIHRECPNTPNPNLVNIAVYTTAITRARHIDTYHMLVITIHWSNTIIWSLSIL